MYKPYDYGEPIDEDEGFHAKPVRREPKKSSSSRWVFISRKADIGIVLVLLLSTGFGIMWFISQLPIFVETASNHYHWAKAVYATWGTPSMRWLFINLVVGVIVATSGLLSAFGGDSSSPHDTARSAPGYDKGVEYRGPEPSVLHGGAHDRAYNASEARFTGPGYESPLYNPYVDEPVKERLHHESSFGSWNDSDDTHSGERERERGGHRRGMHHVSMDEEGGGHRRGMHHGSMDEERGGHRRGMHHGSMDEAAAPFARPVNPEAFARPVDPEAFARPVDPEVLRAAKPVSRQGSQRRGVPTPADEGAAPVASRDLPRELFDTPPAARGGDMPSGEIPISREIPREMPPAEEQPPPPPPPPPRETPVSREVPVPMEPVPAAEETPPPPETGASEELSSSAVGARKEDAIEIISKVYDPVPELAQLEADHGGKFHRLNTDSGIHFSGPLDESSADSSPARAEALHKTHTFTLSRVIRRDQLADFIEPLSRKLEGIGRKVSHKSFSHSDSGTHHHHNQSRELPGPVAPGALTAAIEAVRNSAPQQPPAEKHSRRSSESLSTAADGNIPKQTSVPVIPNKVPPIVPPSPPSPPLLKQRSIVYPPALLSQASVAPADGELSPPPSPPIEEAIPPPPPPHLKLPAAAVTKETDPASMLSSDELPSFKFHLPPSDSTDSAPAAKSSKKQAAEKVSSGDDSKKPPSGKHSRTPSTIPPSQSKGAAGTPEAGSSSGPDERSLTFKARKPNAGDEKVLEVKEGAAPPFPFDKQEGSPGGKDDDLHQQIEDFLARFHENWRLQRQESLARYKKRLTELDEV